MFNAKRILYQSNTQQRDQDIHHEIPNSLLALEMNDRTGKQYHDLDILEVEFPLEGKNYPMRGVIRYFGGRFEVVCPWGGAERFIAGLNPKHRIIGNWAIEENRWMIDDQMKKVFQKENPA